MMTSLTITNTSYFACRALLCLVLLSCVLNQFSRTRTRLDWYRTWDCMASNVGVTVTGGTKVSFPGLICLRQYGETAISPPQHSQIYLFERQRGKAWSTSYHARRNYEVFFTWPPKRVFRKKLSVRGGPCEAVECFFFFLMADVGANLGPRGLVILIVSIAQRSHRWAYNTCILQPQPTVILRVSHKMRCYWHRNLSLVRQDKNKYWLHILLKCSRMQWNPILVRNTLGIEPCDTQGGNRLSFF